MASSGGSSGNVDCKSVARGLWLVKVPKYLSQKWQQEAGSREIGRLKIRPSPVGGPTRKNEVYFHTTDYSEKHGHTAAADDHSIPKEHKFAITNMAQQTLVVLKEDRTEAGSSKSGSNRLTLEGRIIQRAECRPVQTEGYMKMKTKHFEEASKPTRFIQQLDRAEVKFKPVSMHIDHVQAERNKKEGKDKTLRLDKSAVQEMLFRAFQQHQYYNIKDLCRITQQPYSFVREQLSEIGRYITTPPHKNMWELKPEYRHYGDQSAVGGSSS